MIDESMVKAVALTPGVHAIRASPGAVLFRPGDTCRGFILVTAGLVRVGITAANGREIVLYRVRPGEVCLQTFSCLMKGKAYAADGVAEEDVQALVVPPATFDRLLSENPRFRAAVLASVADRFGDFEQVVQALAFTGLEARLAAALTRLAGAKGFVCATHADLAAEIGSAREAVSRQLGLFAQQGLVSLSRGHIALKRPATLAGLADAPV